MSSEFKVCVTGSRNWTDWEFLYTELDNVLERDFIGSIYQTFHLIHGDSPAGGADAIVEDWYLHIATHLKDHYREEHGDFDIERTKYPADIARHGPRGFYLRNQQMIDSKPDLVLGFIMGESSRGTEMTLDMANKAHIPTNIFRRYQ